MTGKGVHAEFEGVIQDAILQLPEDLKVVLQILEDPDLEDDDRTLLAGAILHVLSGHNAIPGQRGLLAYVDDVIVLRLALERLAASNAEVVARHADRAPELLADLPDQMAVIRDYLGDLLQVLDRACTALPKLTHQGHSAAQCARDEDAGMWLYDSVHEAVLMDLEFDEDEVHRAVRNVEQIRRPLEQRLQA